MKIRVLIYFLCISCTIVLAQKAPSVPQSASPPKELAEPFKDVNLCATLKPSQSSVMYSFWTCGVPFKQTYCGLETIFDYQCCPGFQKSSRLNNECGEVESVWKLLPQHLTDYSVPKFSEIIKSKANIPDLFNENGVDTYTVFAPYSDSAMKQGDFDLSGASGSPHPIAMHISKGRLYSDQLKNGVTVKTIFGDHKLKVTTYSNGLVFIDCRALVNPDHESRNGVIHYISGPITPHIGSGYQRQTVLEAMQNDPQTNSFYKDIPPDMRTVLEQDSDNQWFTVFAPTNTAWNEAKSNYNGKIAMLVKNHILKKLICAQAMTKRAESLGPTMANEYLGVDCSSDTSRTIIDACGNQAKIIKEDLVAGNGVVQVIDKVLVPTSVMSASNAIACMNTGNPKTGLSTFLSQSSGCDLGITSGTNYFLLVPTNDAFNWLQNHPKYGSQNSEMSSNEAFKCNVLKYHVLITDDDSCLVNQKSLESNFKSDGKSLSVVTYFVKYRDGSKLFFNAARATHLEPRLFSDGKIFFVDRINIPPSKTMMQLISERTDVSTISGKLKETGYNSQMTSFGHNVLFLAWQDHGWKTRKEKEWGSSDLERWFQLHTIKMELWGDDIGYFHRESYSTVNSVYKENGAPLELKIKRELNGNIYIGYEGLPFELWSLVIESNLHATDGMVWIIDWPLKFRN